MHQVERRPLRNRTLVVCRKCGKGRIEWHVPTRTSKGRGRSPKLGLKESQFYIKVTDEEKRTGIPSLTSMETSQRTKERTLREKHSLKWMKRKHLVKNYLKILKIDKKKIVEVWGENYKGEVQARAGRLWKYKKKIIHETFKKLQEEMSRSLESGKLE